MSLVKTYTIDNFPWKRVVLGKIYEKNIKSKIQIHHNIAIATEASINTDPPNYVHEKYYINLGGTLGSSPYMYGITDESEKKKQLFRFFVDVFVKWPEMDEHGKKIADFMEKFRKTYCNLLSEKKDVRDKIFFSTEQDYEEGDDISKYVKSPIVTPRYAMDYKLDPTLAGQINKNKSPNFKIKPWSRDIPAGSISGNGKIILSAGDIPGCDDLEIFTKFYDFTRGIDTINSEQQLMKFVYKKGDNKINNKPMFKLFLSNITIIPPSIFWGNGKKGDFQFKCIENCITAKRFPKTFSEKSPEELMKIRNEGLNVLQGIPDDGFNHDDGDFYDNDNNNNNDNDYGYGYDNNQKTDQKIQHPRTWTKKSQTHPEPEVIMEYDVTNVNIGGGGGGIKRSRLEDDEGEQNSSHKKIKK